MKQESEKLKQVTKNSERQDQSLTQAQIDPLRQGQRLDAIDQKPKHDPSKTEVTLDEENQEPRTKQKLLKQSFSLSQVQLSQNDALSKPCAQQVFQKSNKPPPCSITSPKNSPPCWHMHTSSSPWSWDSPWTDAMQWMQCRRCKWKHSGIQRYEQHLVTSTCASINKTCI